MNPPSGFIFIFYSRSGGAHHRPRRNDNTRNQPKQPPDAPTPNKGPGQTRKKKTTAWWEGPPGPRQAPEGRQGTKPPAQARHAGHGAARAHQSKTKAPATHPGRAKRRQQRSKAGGAPAQGRRTPPFTRRAQPGAGSAATPGPKTALRLPPDYSGPKRGRSLTDARARWAGAPGLRGGSGAADGRARPTTRPRRPTRQTGGHCASHTFECSHPLRWERAPREGHTKTNGHARPTARGGHAGQPDGTTQTGPRRSRHRTTRRAHQTRFRSVKSVLDKK